MFVTSFHNDVADVFRVSYDAGEVSIMIDVDLQHHFWTQFCEGV